MELRSDIERAANRRIDLAYTVLGTVGVFLLLAAVGLSLYYVEALLAMSASAFIEVTARVLPLYVSGGACLACRHLHSRLHRVESLALDERIAALEQRLLEREDGD